MITEDHEVVELTRIESNKRAHQVYGSNEGDG